MKKTIIFALAVAAGSFISSCSKSYTCYCDADGVAPFQQDFSYELEADSKEEARDQCRSIGDECGLDL